MSLHKTAVQAALVLWVAGQSAWAVTEIRTERLNSVQGEPVRWQVKTDQEADTLVVTIGRGRWHQALYRGDVAVGSVASEVGWLHEGRYTLRAELLSGEEPVATAEAELGIYAPFARSRATFHVFSWGVHWGDVQQGPRTAEQVARDLAAHHIDLPTLAMGGRGTGRTFAADQVHFADVGLPLRVRPALNLHTMHKPLAEGETFEQVASQTEGGAFLPDTGIWPLPYATEQIHMAMASGVQSIGFFTYNGLGDTSSAVHDYEWFDALGGLLGRVKQLAGLWMVATPSRKRVALLNAFTTDAFMTTRGLQEGLWYQFHIGEQAHAALLRAHLPAEVIGEEAIRRGRLADYEALVLMQCHYLPGSVADQPLGPVKIEAASTIAADTQLDVRATVRAADGVDLCSGTVPLWIELTDAEGQHVAFGGAAAAVRGAWRGTLRLARNAPTGTWTLQVENLADGDVTTVPIVVEAP